MKTTKQATKTLFSLLLLCFLSLFSCKKDGSSNNSATSSASKTSPLTSSLWTFQEFEYQKTDGSWVPDTGYNYDRHFTLLFSASNTTFEQDLVNGITINGTWSFSTNNTILTITAGSNLLAGSYNIVQLNSSTLQLINSHYPNGSVYTNERVTFTH